MRLIDKYQESSPFFKHGIPNKCPYYYIYCIGHVKIRGLWLEFGVHDGTSINLISDLTHYLIRATPSFASSLLGNGVNPLNIYGFDSFEGLPEDWVSKDDRKNFDRQGNLAPVYFPNIKLVKGWFNETIPQFKNSFSDKVAFLHIDCDIYSSTIDILEGLKDRIVPGTVILFDEFHDCDNYAVGEVKDGAFFNKGIDKKSVYPQYKDHEYKAWLEFTEKYQVDYNWIAHLVDAPQAALVIKDIKI